MIALGSVFIRTIAASQPAENPPGQQTAPGVSLCMVISMKCSHNVIKQTLEHILLRYRQCQDGAAEKEHPFTPNTSTTPHLFAVTSVSNKALNT